MKVVPPIAVTAANMTSNVAAMDFEAYSLTKAYQVGESVTINNINWEALIANTGKNPETDKSSPPTGSTRVQLTDGRCSTSV